MKNAIVAIIVLIIAGAAAWFVCTTRAHAVEHLVCTSPVTLQPLAVNLDIDMPNRVVTISGGTHAGAYKGVNVTAEEITWQGQGEFTFSRASGRLAVMKNQNNVVSLATADCQPKSLYDRFVSWVS